MFGKQQVLSSLLVWAAWSTTSSLAFSPPSSFGGIAKTEGTSSSSSLTELNIVKAPVSTGYDSFERIKTITDIPSGERQRSFRRTVYTHDDWKKHRDQNRFVVYLAAIFNSGVYKNLAGEVVLVTAIATFVCFWNALTGGFTGFDGTAYGPLLSGLPQLGIPLTAFTLTSPSLGLLLVFRTNTSYQRWDEARKNWGMNINHTRNLNRMANAYYDSTDIPQEERQEDLKYVALCTWAFVRSMKRHLSPEEEDEAAFAKELYEKLPPKQAEMILAAAHRPNRALQDLSYSIDNLPMHFMRKNEVQRAVTIFEDNLGSSERILTSPVPLFYSRHLARFLAVWLFLLPFGVYDAFSKSWNHVGMIPAMTVISLMLFGIEEIGTQLEEPFTVLPMQAFCDKIYNWCTEIASWTPGDHGRPLKPIKKEHAYFTTDVISGPGISATPMGMNGSSMAPPPPVAYTPPPPPPEPVQAVATPPPAVPQAPPVQQTMASQQTVAFPAASGGGEPKSLPSQGMDSFEAFLRNQGQGN